MDQESKCVYHTNDDEIGFTFALTVGELYIKSVSLRFNNNVTLLILHFYETYIKTINSLY